MSKLINQKKVKKTIKKMLDSIKDPALNRPEILTVFGQVLINTGYQIYYQMETNKEPTGKIEPQEAYDLYFNEPTLGTTFMKLGFDFQGPVLKEVLDTIEKENKEKNDN